MVEWPREDLYFAVIDGSDPVGWKPWSNDALSFGSLQEKWDRHVEGTVQPQRQPEVALIPLTDPIDHLLKVGRTGRIVGAMIEATTDPADLEDYTEKMDRLDNMCLGIAKGDRVKKAMVRTVPFEIWFMVDDRDIAKWDRWNRRARAVVSESLRLDPIVRWVRDSESFLDAGDHFLADSRYNLVFRAS